MVHVDIALKQTVLEYLFLAVALLIAVSIISRR